ncbi:MAG: zinc-binding dehydrogenase [Vicinamibacteria bacterium]|nr:zinc-binding dehydrogenase [Vicinamibacteria bacterium]
MRQVVITRHGSPRVLRVRETAEPRAGSGQVRIRVIAAGVNFADLLARMGLYPDAPRPPCVTGFEVAGVIDATGDDVFHLQIGTRVAAILPHGGHSEIVVAPSGAVFPLPESLPFETAAALPVNYLTAWIMLIHIGSLQKGRHVLIHSAGGGVGLAAIQLCRWRGASVIGVASAHKHERLRALGVRHCVDSLTDDFEHEVRRLTDGRGVDVVIDAVGGESFRKSYRCLAPLGRLFVYGASSLAPGRKRRPLSVLLRLFRMPRFNPLTLMNQNRGVFGVHLGHLGSQPALLRDAMERLLMLTANGTLAPIVDRVFPFEEAAAAHAYIHERKNFGKILLSP